MLRDDSSDVVFSSESGKWNAVLTEIKRMHKTGRPVLVGTTSVERSEQLAELLQEAEITYQVSKGKDNLLSMFNVPQSMLNNIHTGIHGKSAGE